MDPITIAIVTLLEADQGDSSPKNATIKAYEGLKTALKEKYGADSDLMAAVEGLEKRPDSDGRKTVLHEEIENVRADQDAQLLNLAQTLLSRMRQQSQTLKPPLQRLVRVEKVIGRDEELRQIQANLQPGRIVALCGPGGVGKSTLAAEVVWQLSPDENPPDPFPDGIIYHNFYNQPRVDITLEQITRLLGEVPRPSAYDAAERALAKRNLLLVLDGAEQADDLSGLLSIRGSAGVLLTTRSSHSAITEQYDIQPLPLDHAVALLQSRKVMRGADQVAGQIICDLVGRLPLAIELIKHYLAVQGQKSSDYLEWLRQTSLTTLKPDQRSAQSVPVILKHSLAQLSETARHALAVAGLLALEPFDKEVIVGTLTIKTNQGLLSALRGFFRQKDEEQKMPDVSQAIRELVHYGLLRQVGKRYQVSHPLIHSYARQHMTAPEQSIRQLATYFVALAWEQGVLGPEGYARLDVERPHIMKVLSGCVEWEDWEAAHGLAVAIEDYLDRQGYWAERVIANEVGLIASWQLGRPSEGAWLGNLGDTYRIMGHTKWAIEHFEKALATARQTGNLHSQGNALGNLGLAYRDLGQLDQAKSHLEQALPIFEKIRSPSAKMIQDWLDELEQEEI